VTYQSPISPGVSWYEDDVGERPRWPRLDGDRRADVVVVGGGYTGLSAAAHLAEAGADVVLLEAHRIGDGASGRNGGQFGTGPRHWPEELEAELGFARAKALFDLAEEAKAHVLAFARRHGFDIEFTPGQISAVHKKSLIKDHAAHVEAMATRFGYPHLRFMDQRETAERLGSARYFGGTYDSGTGHIHPMKLVLGTARAAAAAGAHLVEQSGATAIRAQGGKVIVTTASGTVTASQGFIAVNAHGKGIEPESASHIMPVGSFMGATAPLPEDSPILPGRESVADSRFVVRYFRRLKNGRLLFGGREVYAPGDAREITPHIRRQIAEIYPALADVEITHAWGGYVGITMSREPYVREVMPGVIAAGGYSGHGVMIAHHTGRLYAEAVLGNREKLRLLEDLKIPLFPGGPRFRSALLFLALNWYAMLDRI
jgi:gamma-glutamylputrescine oxidase